MDESPKVEVSVTPSPSNEKMEPSAGSADAAAYAASAAVLGEKLGEMTALLSTLVVKVEALASELPMLAARQAAFETMLVEKLAMVDELLTEAGELLEEAETEEEQQSQVGSVVDNAPKEDVIPPVAKPEQKTSTLRKVFLGR